MADEPESEHDQMNDVTPESVIAGATAMWDQALAASQDIVTLFEAHNNALRVAGFGKWQAFILVRDFHSMYWRYVFDAQLATNFSDPTDSEET